MLGASLLDGVPKELMEVIDPHWGQFPPQVNSLRTLWRLKVTK